MEMVVQIAKKILLGYVMDNHRFVKKSDFVEMVEQKEDKNVMMQEHKKEMDVISCVKQKMVGIV